MGLVAILTWLKNNWLPLAGVIAMIALFGFGYHVGSYVETNTCNAKITDIHDAAEKSRVNIQDAADKQSAIYEASKSKQAKAIKSLKGKLVDVENKNAAFNSCHAGTDFVQLYRDAATSPDGNSSP